MRQMELMVRHYLHEEPAEDLDQLLEQFAGALWIEERQATMTANAVAKSMGGK